MLKNTGMRMSEALSLTANSIDFSTKCVVVESLKKRRNGIFRQIPLSDEFLGELNLVFEIRSRQRIKKKRDQKLWDFTRRTGQRRVDKVMKCAGIIGEKSSSQGLRHSFGVACIMREIPLPVVQKWMGHASMETTAIYLQVVGKEEREIASRLWTK